MAVVFNSLIQRKLRDSHGSHAHNSMNSSWRFLNPPCRNQPQVLRWISALSWRKKTGRALGIWLLLCTLVVNSWALQSHVHRQTDIDGDQIPMVLAGAGHSDADSTYTKGHTPSPLHCPLCQQLALGGLTSLPPFLPAIFAFHRPLAAARRPEEQALPVTAPQAHHWSSRAPPRL